MVYVHRIMVSSSIDNGWGCNERHLSTRREGQKQRARARSLSGPNEGIRLGGALAPVTSSAKLLDLPARGAARVERVGSRTETATATAATEPAASTATAAAARVGSHLLEFPRDLGLRLAQNANQLACLLAVVTGEVGVRGTLGSSTAGTTDTVNVVLAVVGEVIVDNVAAVSAQASVVAA